MTIAFKLLVTINLGLLPALCLSQIVDTMNLEVVMIQDSNLTKMIDDHLSRLHLRRVEVTEAITDS